MNPILNTVCAAAIGSAPVLVAVAPAPAGPASPPVRAMQVDTTEGMIRSIAEDKSSFVIWTEDEDRVTVRVDDKTVYMLDGEGSLRDAALQIGRTAIATHTDGVASRVDVFTKDDPER